MLSVTALMLLSAGLGAQAAPMQERTPDRIFWASRPVEIRPFVTVGVASAEGIDTLAFRNVYDREQSATYYVAMRRLADGVGIEELDSRSCDFAGDLVSLRSLEMPELQVPGTLPVQFPPPPQFQHFTWTVSAYRARQSDDQAVAVTMSAGHGPIAEWSRTLFQKVSACFRSASI